MKIMTVFFLLLISSAAVILAQTAHIQPVQAKRQCEFEEGGGFTCQGGFGGCDTFEGIRTCGGQGGRTESEENPFENESTGGGGGRTEIDSGESAQGGQGGRRECTVDPDTNIQTCEEVGGSSFD